MTTVANEIIKFARSKLGTIVKYKPTKTGKCEELVYAALDYANARKGLRIINVQTGDIVIFANQSGKVIIEVIASAQGKKYSVLEYYASSTRSNHIAIVSKAPDKNGKIFVLEQNSGKLKSVTESPVNTRNKVSYSKSFPANTSFTVFKKEYITFIEAEFTKEETNEVVNNLKTWKGLEEWFNSQVKYSFMISVSYTGLGTIEYYRPEKN